MSVDNFECLTKSISTDFRGYFTKHAGSWIGMESKQNRVVYEHCVSAIIDVELDCCLDNGLKHAEYYRIRIMITNYELKNNEFEVVPVPVSDA